MSVLPDGSGVLLCPVGPEFSMIGDRNFNLFSSSNFSRVVEVSPEVFAAWYSNAKRVIQTLTFRDEDGVERATFSYNFSQRTGDNNPDSDPFNIENTGDHPFPLMRAESDQDGQIEVFTSVDPFVEGGFQYVAFAGEFITNTNLPFQFFIHRDKFYARLYLSYLISELDSVFVGASRIALEYTIPEEAAGGSLTEELEIVDYFY